MKKESILKYILSFMVIICGLFFFNNHVIAEEISQDEKITSINPQENTFEKILFIKNKYEKNKIYTIIEDENTFTKILTSVWLLRPKGKIEFEDDGRFKAYNAEKNINVAGFWKYHNGELKLSFDNKRWDTLKVKKYKLSFAKSRRENCYGFSISFDKMICDMSSVLQISFYTK